MHISGNNGYTGGGVYNAVSVAIDASGNAWFADDENFANLSEFSTSGAPVSPTGGYGGGGLVFPGPGRCRTGPSTLRAMFGQRPRGKPREVFQYGHADLSVDGIYRWRDRESPGHGDRWRGKCVAGELQQQQCFRVLEDSGTAITSFEGVYRGLAAFRSPSALPLIAPATYGSPAIATKSVAELIGAATPCDYAIGSRREEQQYDCHRTLGSTSQTIFENELNC